MPYFVLHKKPLISFIFLASIDMPHIASCYENSRLCSFSKTKNRVGCYAAARDKMWREVTRPMTCIKANLARKGQRGAAQWPEFSSPTSTFWKSLTKWLKPSATSHATAPRRAVGKMIAKCAPAHRSILALPNWRESLSHNTAPSRVPNQFLESDWYRDSLRNTSSSCDVFLGQVEQ